MPSFGLFRFIFSPPHFVLFTLLEWLCFARSSSLFQVTRYFAIRFSTHSKTFRRHRTENAKHRIVKHDNYLFKIVLNRFSDLKNRIFQWGFAFKQKRFVCWFMNKILLINLHNRRQRYKEPFTGSSSKNINYQSSFLHCE